MRTKAIYSNCHFGLFYLLIRRKAKYVILAPGGNIIIPFHVGVLTNKDHYINFYRLLPHEQNTYGAWWFLGSFRGLRRSKWKDIISARGKIKKIKFSTALIIYVLGYFILFCPWVFCWAFFGPLWSLYWLLQGMQK